MLKFIDAFAGIGGFHEAMLRVDPDARCVLAAEKDRFASLTYHNQYGDSLDSLHGDIGEVVRLPEADVLFAGFPCQPFSLGGKRKGFADERGGVIFTLLNLVDKAPPPLMILENVKGLRSHDGGKSLGVILNRLAEHYVWSHAILNSTSFGVPQNRERLFIVCVRKDRPGGFFFPYREVKGKLSDYLESEKVDRKYYYDSKVFGSVLKRENLKKGVIYQWRYNYLRENKSGVCPTLTAQMGRGGRNIPIIKDDWGYRHLTLEECLRLQGFPDDFAFPDEVAKSQRYKMVGNSVCVPVVEALLHQVLPIVFDKEALA